MAILTAGLFYLGGGLLVSSSSLAIPSNHDELYPLAEEVSYSTMPFSRVAQGISMGGMRIIIPDAGFPYVFGDSTADVEGPGDASENNENDYGNDYGVDEPAQADVNTHEVVSASDLLIEV